MLVVFKLFNMFLSSVQSRTASCKLWNGIVLYFIHDIEWWRCVKASYYITIYTHIFYCACQFTQCTFFCFHFVILLVQKSLLVFLFELCAQYMFCFQNFVFLFCHDQHIFCVKCQSSSGFSQIMIYLLMSVLLWMSFWIFKVISGYCLYGWHLFILKLCPWYPSNDQHNFLCLFKVCLFHTTIMIVHVLLKPRNKI